MLWGGDAKWGVVLCGWCGVDMKGSSAVEDNVKWGGAVGGDVRKGSAVGGDVKGDRTVRG